MIGAHEAHSAFEVDKCAAESTVSKIAEDCAFLRHMETKLFKLHKVFFDGAPESIYREKLVSGYKVFLSLRGSASQSP